MKILDVKNLNVEIENKKILSDVNLELEKGKIYVLMGQNGSGKSTLANALMGNPKYKISSGNIYFEGENITKKFTDYRAKKGMFMSFQSPQEIQGLSIANFLRQAYNSTSEKKLTLLEFNELLEKKAKLLNLDENFVDRYLNQGFSGGEKKKSEILQLLVLGPKFAILDETDSGLDIDSLREVAEAVQKYKNENRTVLIITHYKRILDYLNPDKVFIMKNGKIVRDGGPEIIDKLEEKGYGWIENEYRI